MYALLIITKIKRSALKNFELLFKRELSNLYGRQIFISSVKSYYVKAFNIVKFNTGL